MENDKKEPVGTDNEIPKIDEKEIMPRSRLKTTSLQAAKKNIILTVAGIVGILILLAFFGMPLLINLSLFFEKSTDSSASHRTTDTYVEPPVLEPLTTATNSAKIIVSGSAPKDSTVILFVNDTKVDEKEITDYNGFSFHDVTLDEGENYIKAKAKIDKNQISSYSEEQKVTLLNKPPKLELEKPNESSSFQKDDSPIEVKGKTDPKVRVTVNGFWAIVDQDGNFSYNLPLQGGDNQIRIVATDEAGNKTEKEIKVTYSP